MVLLLVVIGLALAFDVINGFHDAANAIATVVTTRVLTPVQAVVWAAFFNFIAYLVFGLHVADTIAKGIVHTESVTLPVITSALVAALGWNLLTWWLGIPSSSSHTLIGGFVGAAIAHAGWHAVFYGEIFRIIAFIILAPLIGMLVAIVLSYSMLWIFSKSNPGKVNHLFRRLQLFSAAAYSLGHGGNDAQKTMGIIGAGQHPLPEGGRCHSALDSTELPRRHGSRDFNGWLAYCEDNGFKDYPPNAFPGLQRRNGWRIDAVWNGCPWYTSQYHPYHCRRHHGCRSNTPFVSSPLGRYP